MEFFIRMNKFILDSSLVISRKRNWRFESHGEVVTDQKIPISKSIPAIITVQQSEKRVVRYGTKISGPGFYKGTLKCSWDGGQVSQTVQVGYAPEALLPPLTREPDFKRFWDESRVKLQKVDPQYQLLLKPELSKGDLNVYEVRMRSYGDIRVRGWYLSLIHI